MGLVRLGTKTPRHFQMVASPANLKHFQAFPANSGLPQLQLGNVAGQFAEYQNADGFIADRHNAD